MLVFLNLYYYFKLNQKSCTLFDQGAAKNQESKLKGQKKSACSTPGMGALVSNLAKSASFFDL